RLTGLLQSKWGVRPGDRVGLWLKNRPEFVTGLYGALGAGAVVVPINNFLKPDEINYILKDADVNVLITEADLAVHEPALCAARPGLKLVLAESLPQNGVSAKAAAPSPSAEPTADSLAVLIYTSGTTGRPKGA